MKQDQIEKILEKWGETKDPDPNGNLLPVLVALGYKIGQQWASIQQQDDLLARFESFYHDWTDNRLTTHRYKLLHEELAPASIVAEMSDILSRALVDPRMAEAMLENFHLFEKGIVWGLMSVIRNIISGRKPTSSRAS